MHEPCTFANFNIKFSKFLSGLRIFCSVHGLDLIDKLANEQEIKFTDLKLEASTHPSNHNHPKPFLLTWAPEVIAIRVWNAVLQPLHHSSP